MGRLGLGDVLEAVGGASVAGLAIADVVARTAGAEGTAVALRLRSPDTRVWTAAVVRRRAAPANAGRVCGLARRVRHAEQHFVPFLG